MKVQSKKTGGKKKIQSTREKTGSNQPEIFLSEKAVRNLVASNNLPKLGIKV